MIFCFNDTATTEIYTLALHDALPIDDDLGLRREVESLLAGDGAPGDAAKLLLNNGRASQERGMLGHYRVLSPLGAGDRKSTRLNSSHANISYAVFCLKQKRRTASSRT